MKKFFVLLLLVAPMSLLAQKFGYVNSSDIMQYMPEYATAITEIQELERLYTEEFNSMRTELETKGTEFERMQRDSIVPQSILERRYEELMQMQERLQQYGQVVQENLQRAEQEKFVNIQTILREALNAVGEEEGYICIFDVASGIPYISTTLCEDVNQKVRAKLGIPVNATPFQAPAQAN